jgi:hypothetical protein
MTILQNTLRYCLLCFCLSISIPSDCDVYGPSTSSGNFTITWDPPPSQIYDYWVEESFNGGPVQKYYPDDYLISFNKTTNGAYYYEVIGRGERCSGGHQGYRSTIPA